ncbi:hypothetical protein ACFU51_17575 [Streptomyces sp. NPDC057430]|uniref:hypothetical protein n=1 Tax=Streptomyces sp. NPDC057430 TaxID=3346131 RepID=UPI0036758692
MRSNISRKLITAAATTGILSLTGGLALAANSLSNAGHSPDPGAGHHVQVPVPVPPDLCGDHAQFAHVPPSVVAELCGPSHEEEPGGYGDDESTPPTKPPTTPPTKPPTTPPTKPPTTPPTKPPTTPPTKPPTTPPTSTPSHPGGPGGPGESHGPDKPHLPDTGGDSVTMGAAAVSAALIIGGTVVYLRAGRVAGAGRRERRH